MKKEQHEYNREELVKYLQDIWKTKEFRQLLDQFEQELEAASKDTRETDKGKMIMLFQIASSMTTAREITYLCELGFPDGAFSLTRKLYEQAIHRLFFMVHKNDSDYLNILNDYELNGEYQIHKYNKERAEIFDDVDKTELEEEFERIKQQSIHSFPPERFNDYWWSGKGSFQQMVKDVEDAYPLPEDKLLLKKLHLFYIASNRFLHVNAAGNMQRLGKTNPYHVIDTSLSLNGQQVPLYNSVLCLILVMLPACQTFNMNFQYYKDNLNELAVYYSTQQSFNQGQ